MTTYGGVDLGPDVWGFDTAVLGALTDEQLVKVFTTPIPMPAGAPETFFEYCWGYCPLPGNSSKWDLTGSRLRAIADMQNGAGKYVKAGFVQHCRGGMWVASADEGASDGAFAADYVTKQGYTNDCHLCPDDEAVKNPGPDAIAHFTVWCSKWQAPCLYEGFSPGMTSVQLYDLPDVEAYWGAFGPWNVATRGVRCRQGQTITFCGVSLDPDHATPDRLGGVLRLYGRLPDPT